MILRLALEAMGTRFELVLDGGDEFALRAAGEAALQEVREQHDRLSVFRPGSLLGRVNERAAAGPVGVDQDLFELLSLCRRVWLASGGAFDPAVGGLMHRYGFRAESPTPAPRGADGPVNFAAVELDETNGTVRFTRPGVALDFGGVAKGWALDRAGEILRAAGVGTAMIHGGTSSAVAIGTPPDSEGWSIQIPSHRDDVPALRCLLWDRALSVSSPLGRTVVRDGRTIGHVLDPSRGEPARGTLVAAVACGSAAEADAWSTALVVSGARAATMPHAAAWAVLAESGAGWTIAPDGEPVFTIRHGAESQGEERYGGQ